VVRFRALVDGIRIVLLICIDIPVCILWFPRTNFFLESDISQMIAPPLSLPRIDGMCM